MKWSFSAAKTFAICPRRWFYANVCANARAKDRIRKQAYHLKQLQTLSAWRGSLVDTVISVAIVPKLNNKTIPSESDVLSYASSLATKQMEFGKARRHKASEVSYQQHPTRHSTRNTMMEPGIRKNLQTNTYCFWNEIKITIILKKFSNRILLC